MARRTDLAYILEQTRLKLGLSQMAAAKLLGVARKTLWSWEQGHSVPNVAMLFVVAAVYALDHDELVEMRGRATRTRSRKKKNGLGMTAIL